MPLRGNEALMKRVMLFAQILRLLAFLYLFLFSIDLLGTSMKLFGREAAETLIASTSNPLVGLFIGILSTSLVQSSSTTTSIVVGLVGGGTLPVVNAIPIIMGANIGTSVTNTLVALANLNRSAEFRRSFAASTVHDFFNFLAVLVLFPLQYFTNFLDSASIALARVFEDAGGMVLMNPLKAATKPLVNFAVGVMENPWFLLALSLLILFVALRQMVLTLRILVMKRAEAWFDKVLFRNAGTAFLVGLVLTIMAQSSSITTSLVIPLAGAGILTLKQIFPYTLGANVGTTVTAILASMVTGNIHAVEVAFAHLIFNLAGIMIWWPFSQVPVELASRFGSLATRNRLIPFFYILTTFFAVPLVVILFLR
jgi:sodium-dependent phosphate cotransporter